MYPRQTTTEWNGLPFGDDTTLALTFDGPVDDAAFAIPDETKTTYASLASRPAGMRSLALDESRAVLFDFA